MAFIPSKLPLLSLEAILETISKLTLNIQQGQPLGEILQGAIADAQKLLPADRVLIYRIPENQEPVIAFEAVSESCLTTLGQRIYQACSPATWLAPAQQGQITILSLFQETLPPDYREQLERLQVKAQVVVPIFNQSILWGLLIAHDCRRSRNWTALEIQYLQQLALHLSVAVQQATLQQSNQHLWAELQQRPVIYDATHNSEAEAALQEREYYYAQILNSVQEMVFCKAPGSIVTYANQAACNYYGMTLEELRGITDVPFNQLDFTQQYIQDDLQVFTTGEVVNRLEEPNQRPDGEIRYFHTIKSPIFDANGNISQIVGVSRDITERKQTEAALWEQQRFTEEIAESTLAILYVYDLIEQRNIYCNHQIENVLGYNPDEIEAMGNTLFPQLIHPDDLSHVLSNYQQFCCLEDGEFSEIEYRARHKAGNCRWLLARDKILKRTPEGKPQHIVGVAVDVTELKETQAILHQQTERERLLMAIAKNIRQTLDLEQILHTAVAEVRQLLQSDRVVIYRFEADGSSIIVAESVAEGWTSVLGMQSAATSIETLERTRLDGQVIPIDDIHTAGLGSDNLERLEQMQVQAELRVPILQNSHLWGFLAAHHCQHPRHWEPFEIALQQQLATQLAIAIQQSELYQRVQSLNSGLELQVQERTAQLQQSLEFEALLRRITDRVRDSLHEGQILQAAVDELAHGLNLAGCDTGIYNSDQTTSTIAYESVSILAPAQGFTFEIATAGHPEVYPYLLSGQSCQFCNLGRNPLHLGYQVMSILAVPIFDDQGVLGDLWLFKLPQEVFDEQEVRLVQQVANHCAIALRQSRLYQAAQAQVQELERLSQLKDDFLSTVSHELRSPMSNIKMATQMLEISLERLGVLSDSSHPIHRYFSILREEGQREISLINDLLDLARFEAGMDDLELAEVNLQVYLPHLAKTFAERMQQQQQHFILQLPPNLPSLTTDSSHLERILVELLHNACKYTPAQETITLSAHTYSNGIEILVSNSGVEIPEVERDRIFDKFYRIPNNDPWKHKGTGLGLALVKKLVEHLGGTITVTSPHNQTRFTVHLPQ